ncbi:expressed protein [Phakopsora pachyrhizi]|uniref:Postreplication repair E3 ubiquitin-protein ligase RAD18 n=1 Tax=Phakopsora pachyrhizi TaxID=170000 RepID=A0AAV0B1Q6_PHAPC|nr:expressed protein [Phakopsora pachyrhizi]
MTGIQRNSFQNELLKVSAPEDFPSKLRNLGALDSTLRCPICKDFYQAPVIIHISNCCHTFCSACIRTCFNNNSDMRIGASGLGGVGSSQRCPICKVAAQEEKIKPVPTLEAAVKVWEEARSEVFKLIEQVHSLSSQKIETNDPASQFSNETSSQAHRGGFDSKLSKNYKENSPSGSGEAKLESSSTREPRPTRVASQKASKKLEKCSSKQLTNRSSESDSDIELLDPKAIVDCFICGARLPNSSMDSHITKCLSGEGLRSGKLPFKSISSAKPSQKNNFKSTSRGTIAGKRASQIPENKIALPHLSSMKLKELKAELVKLKLSTDGPQNVLNRRLSRYITLFNANIDSDPIHRRTVESLKEELEEWERLQEIDAAKRRKLNGESKFAVEHFIGHKRTVITSQAEYLQKNKDQFELLTARAAIGHKKKSSAQDSNSERKEDKDINNLQSSIQQDLNSSSSITKSVEL